MSSLSSICETLETKAENNASFDKILLDYLVLISSEKIDICKYARDPYLRRFTQLAFQPFMRLNTHSKPQFRANVLEIIKFFESLFMIHPAFLDCAASVLPIDTVLQIVLPIGDNDLTRGVVGFIAHICTAPSILASSATSAKIISDCILSMINVPVLSGYSIVMLAGLIRFSPIFETTIKSSSELRKYKNILSNALSCDDHVSVVASISALLTLFPRSVDLDTAKVAALHAINVSNSNVLLLKSALWIYVEVTRENGITSNDILSLMKLASSNVGWKAFCLFETLNCILANGGINVLDMEKDIRLQKIIRFILSQRYGFVAYSAIRFVQQLVEHDEKLFDQLKDCEKLTIRALEIASAPSLSVDIDLIECSVVLLRFISKSKECFETVKSVLLANEENVFVAFQRSIESNRSYASLQFFLFLADISRSLIEWNKRLRLIVIDSQFGALLAHVLEKSTDRQTICDGIRAVAIISNFSEESNITDGELLFDCIVSGFAVVNLQNQKDARIFKAATTDQIAKNEEDIFALKSQVEVKEVEFQSMKNAADNAINKCQQQENKMTEMASQISELKAKLENVQENLNKKQKEFDDLSNNYNILQKENAEQKNVLNMNSTQIISLNENIKKYTEIEKEKSRIDRDNAQYEQKVANFQQTIDQLNEKIKSLNDSIANYKNKFKENKAQLADQLAALQKSESEREKINLQMIAMKEKMDSYDQAHDSEKEKYNLLKTKVRELSKTVESLRSQSNDLRVQLDAEEQKNNELNGQLTILLTERKQWELVTQFVHRITDENPVPSEQLITLFHDT